MVRLLRFFFHLLYNPFALFYDLVSWSVSFGQWRSWQRAALPYLRGGRILEIAHGTGDLLLDMRALGLNPLGFDLSANMGRIAKRKLNTKGIATPLVRGNVKALPFPTGYFTSMAATFPAEFVFDPSAIAEFYRVLAPGGVFVCVPAAHITGGSLGDRLARWLFQVTHQAPNNDEWATPLLKRYIEGGFRAHIENTTLPRSVVTVIMAEKPLNPRTG